MGEPALNLFFSYSHKDEPLRDELEKHLKILERQKIIANWHDRKILPGDEWDHQIDDNLKKADIILLLISADFIASRYCWEVEITVAMERHNAGEAVVIPVILRPVVWQNAPFGKLQFLPTDADPITSWTNQDDAFVNVTKGLRTCATELIERRKQKEQEAKKQAALSQYGHKVEELAVNGQISFGSKLILGDLQEQLGLTDPEVQTIQTEVLKPHHDYQRHLNKYKQAFTHYAQQQYPLTQAAIDDLKILENYYQLQKSDIETIITEFEQQQTKAINKSSQLLTFPFEIITVNSRGQEIGRQPGQAEYFEENLGEDVRLDMVAIPGGTFWMGTDDEEIERLCKKYGTEWFRNEKPQHQVTISPFFMGKYPITQKQWQAIAVLDKVNMDLEPNPSHFKGENRPVERVNWYEAVEFCQRLSRETRKDYGLPSEAQWERAARRQKAKGKGQKDNPPFYFGETITGELANYNASKTYADEQPGEYREQTTPVGQFPPNAFGLYDMHGNVWEWCADEWHQNYEGAPTDGSAWLNGNDNFSPLRGGSWVSNPDYCRSAFRDFNDAREVRINNYGFRVVCVFGRNL